ncbi:hypothetical protein RI129_002772 [Pyrocoelia pectoralis]|uniref:Uncharacterized protein n=1 Tax=Pyrocoelia pectoralis TaxID=417401 RepID=A0AAN7VGM6_9COLE
MVALVAFRPLVDVRFLIVGTGDLERTFLYLPFINAPPSDYDTVYTSLRQCETPKMCQVIVTFDQPLYIKAGEIVACAGEHSELRCIGYIMAGSGLQQLLGTIYAPNSVIKILAGHSYARAVRAQLLVQLALGKIVMRKVTMTFSERDVVFSMAEQFQTALNVEDIDNSNLQVLAEKFNMQLLQLNNNGPTAKLWAQYFRTITIEIVYGGRTRRTLEQSSDRCSTHASVLPQQRTLLVR